MRFTFKNIVKCLIFYTTALMLCYTIGVLLYGCSFTFLCCWFAVLIPLLAVTFFMCKGKTVKQFKEFTGIDLDH